MPKPTSDPHRREIIERLLDHLPDFEPGLIRTASGGSGNPPGSPGLSRHRSVRELYRCLERLAATEVVQLRSGSLARGATIHAHLTAYYHSEWRIVRRYTTRRKRRDGRIVEVREEVPGSARRERVVGDWIIKELVERGVDFAVDNFQGEPFLPKDLLEGIAA